MYRNRETMPGKYRWTDPRETVYVQKFIYVILTSANRLSCLSTATYTAILSIPFLTVHRT